MTEPARILALSGSARRGSLNGKLVEIAAAGARAAGGAVTVVSLADFPLPLFESDEAGAGFPPNARKLGDLARAHDAFLIAAPEHNGGVSAPLKNALDWISRPLPGIPELAAFKGKVAGFVSASPHDMGGLRSVGQLQAILGYLGVVILPYPIAVSFAGQAFDAGGAMVDKGLEARVQDVGARLVTLTNRLKRGLAAP